MRQLPGADRSRVRDWMDDWKRSRKKRRVGAPLFQHFSVKGSQVCLHGSPPHSNMRSASLDQRQSLPECTADSPGEQDGMGAGQLGEEGFSLLMTRGDASPFRGSTLE